MVKTYTVNKPLFKLGNTLGEGMALASHDLAQGPVRANNVQGVFGFVYSMQRQPHSCIS